MIHKYLSVDELELRGAEIRAALDRARARLHQNHPPVNYNRRNDLSLAA